VHRGYTVEPSYRLARGPSASCVGVEPGNLEAITRMASSSHVGRLSGRRDSRTTASRRSRNQALIVVIASAQRSSAPGALALQSQVIGLLNAQLSRRCPQRTIVLFLRAGADTALRACPFSFPADCAARGSRMGDWLHRIMGQGRTDLSHFVSELSHACPSPAPYCTTPSLTPPPLSYAPTQNGTRWDIIWASRVPCPA
jgi:hypothetical protein